MKKNIQRINEGKFYTIGPCLNGVDKKEALGYLKGYAFNEEEPQEQEIKCADFIDTAKGISLYYDYAGDYYFFAIADKNRDDFNKRLTTGEYYMKELKNYKNMKKNVQRINESQLRTIVAESVKKVLKEYDEEGMPVDIEQQEFNSLWDVCCAIRDIMNSENYKEHNATSYREGYLQLQRFLGDIYDYLYTKATNR